jgi:RNA polymerase sigma-70 factor (ECF subfamily)
VSLEALAEDHGLELPDPGAHLAILRQATLEDLSPEVEEALSALPEAFRAAVLLVDVEELSYEEAATVAGVPVGTLRSRLFRARKMLAASLAAWAGRAEPRGR